jgi:hypothetical protein
MLASKAFSTIRTGMVLTSPNRARDVPSMFGTRLPGTTHHTADPALARNAQVTSKTACGQE